MDLERCAGKERYGGSEFGENDLIQKKKLDIVCVRCFPFVLAVQRKVIGSVLSVLL